MHPSSHLLRMHHIIKGTIANVGPAKTKGMKSNAGRRSSGKAHWGGVSLGGISDCGVVLVMLEGFSGSG